LPGTRLYLDRRRSSIRREAVPPPAEGQHTRVLLNRRSLRGPHLPPAIALDARVGEADATSSRGIEPLAPRARCSLAASLYLGRVNWPSFGEAVIGGCG
jgi:hypothetical protein